MKLKRILRCVKSVVGDAKYYKLRNEYIIRKLKKDYPKRYELLQKNLSYKNKYKGKRCFILGNGPSLKEEDLTKLSDEIVFACNYFVQTELFETAKPNFYFMLDNDLFLNSGVNPLKKQDIEKLKNITCFIPVENSPVLKQRNWNIKEINYILVGDLVIPKSMEIDATKVMPGFQTVVQNMIYMAIYMGFSEIYLLGCDTNMLSSVLEAKIQQQNTALHFYEKEKSQKQTIRDENMNVEWWTWVNYIVFKGYRILNHICKARKIKLINLSSRTLIQDIKREKYSEVVF